MRELTLEEGLFPRLRPHVKGPTILRSVRSGASACRAGLLQTADGGTLQCLGCAGRSSENVTASRRTGHDDKLTLHLCPRHPVMPLDISSIVSVECRHACMVRAWPTRLTGRSAESTSWSRGMAHGARGTQYVPHALPLRRCGLPAPHPFLRPTIQRRLAPEYICIYYTLTFGRFEVCSHAMPNRELPIRTRTRSGHKTARSSQIMETQWIFLPARVAASVLGTA